MDRRDWRELRTRYETLIGRFTLSHPFQVDENAGLAAVKELAAELAEGVRRVS